MKPRYRPSCAHTACLILTSTQEVSSEPLSGDFLVHKFPHNLNVCEALNWPVIHYKGIPNSIAFTISHMVRRDSAKAALISPNHRLIQKSQDGPLHILRGHRSFLPKIS